MEGRGFESQFGADSGVARRDYTKNYLYGERNYVYGEEYAMDENSSLAAAVRDSSAHQDSSLSSVYRESALASAHRESYRNRLSSNSETPRQKTYTSNGSSSFRSSNESKQGFWSALARKAKSALLEEGSPAESPELEVRNRSHLQQARANILASMPERRRQSDAPALQKGIEAITSSLTYIGDALEEGLTIVENKASDIISDTKRSIRKKSDAGPERKDSDILSGTRRSMKKKADVGEAANPHKDNVPGESKDSDILSGIRRPMRKRADCVEAANLQWQNKKAPDVEANHETQLKASRDVAMAMAAKVKVLLRELKTLKADLAFAKERCAQLEEENKVLRESLEKGDRPDEDDLIRLQLETLLAEKSRLAQENANYARENRFLREIVEYHRLTMQDVVCLDENIEEVTEIGLDPNTETQIEMIPLEKSISSVSC